MPVRRPRQSAARGGCELDNPIGSIMSKDVLLATARATTWRTELRLWTDVLVKMGLSAKYSVYAVHQPWSDWNIYLSRHDGRPVDQHELYLKLVS